MRTKALLFTALGASLLSACGDDHAKNFPMHACGAADITSAHCVEIGPGDSQGLLTATNSLSADTTIVLAAGTYAMSNEVKIQGLSGIHVLGQGIDVTKLEFRSVTAQVNGVFAANADQFLVQDFTVANAPKDGVRVEASDHVTYRRIKATWDEPSLTTNGAYGIYPVKSKHVLVENSLAENASDAGLYVGQCQYVIVRNNEVRGNVAGLEIENTQYADVYGNDAHDNTAGIVVFDLPKNPIVGRDVRIRENTIAHNNLSNFAAAGGTVASVPAGTGTFAMASRRVEIVDNHYEGNDTIDIGLVSGLVIEPLREEWNLDPASPAFVGEYADLNLLPGWIKSGTSYTPDTSKVSNFRLENIVVARNTHTGSGTNPDTSNANLPVGLLLSVLYMGSDPMSVMPPRAVDSVVYDTVGETDLTTNVNHVCAGGNTMGSFGNLDFAKQQSTFLSTGKLAPYERWDAPNFSTSGADGEQFDCTVLNGTPLVVWDGN